jgi:hypothetical protein
MKYLTDGVIAFFILGVVEALIKPIAKTLIRKKILKYAPVAMSFLDEQMPRMIVENDSIQMRRFLKERLESLTGEGWDDKELDEMFKIYDPRITADKHQR